MSVAADWQAWPEAEFQSSIWKWLCSAIQDQENDAAHKNTNQIKAVDPRQPGRFHMKILIMDLSTLLGAVHGSRRCRPTVSYSLTIQLPTKSQAEAGESTMMRWLTTELERWLDTNHFTRAALLRVGDARKMYYQLLDAGVQDPLVPYDSKSQFAYCAIRRLYKLVVGKEPNSKQIKEINIFQRIKEVCMATAGGDIDLAVRKLLDLRAWRKEMGIDDNFAAAASKSLEEHLPFLDLDKLVPTSALAAQSKAVQCLKVADQESPQRLEHDVVDRVKRAAWIEFYHKQLVTRPKIFSRARDAISLTDEVDRAVSSSGAGVWQDLVRFEPFDEFKADLTLLCGKYDEWLNECALVFQTHWRACRARCELRRRRAERARHIAANVTKPLRKPRKLSTQKQTIGRQSEEEVADALERFLTAGADDVQETKHQRHGDKRQKSSLAKAIQVISSNPGVYIIKYEVDETAYEYVRKPDCPRKFRTKIGYVGVRHDGLKKRIREHARASFGFRMSSVVHIAAKTGEHAFATEQLVHRRLRETAFWTGAQRLACGDTETYGFTDIAREEVIGKIEQIMVWHGMDTEQGNTGRPEAA